MWNRGHKPLSAFLLLACIALILISPVQAVFSPVVNVSHSDVYYNITTTFAPVESTPDWLFILTAGLGIAMLGISLIIKPGAMPKDSALLLSIVSIVPLSIAAWMSLAIDTIASSGVSSEIIHYQSLPVLPSGYIINDTHVDWTLMEHHVIYFPLPITVMLIVFCGISIINIMRIRAEQKILPGETSNAAED